MPADETQLLYSLALHGRGELGLAPDEYSALVMVLLRMLAFKPQGDAGRGEPRPTRPAAAPMAPTRAAALVAPAPAVAVRAPERAPQRAAAQPPVPIAPPARAAVHAVEPPPPWVDAPFDDEVAAPVVQPTPSRVPSPPPRAESAPAQTFAAGGIGQRWAELVREMIDSSRIQAMARELAVQAQCIAFDERAEPLCCVLRVEREMLRAAAHAEKLQAALAETLGRVVRVELEAGVAEDSPARRDAAERARRQAEAEQIIHDDPLVRALMAQYKTARVVPGSVKPH